MKSVYYIKEDKAAVQDFYADVIGRGLKKAGYPLYKIISINEIGQIEKDTIIISISHYLTLRLWLKGFKNIIYWIQGSSPDESFMRNHSYIRKYLISCVEYFALSKAKFVFMVSESMLKHFKKKYHKDYSYKTYIMPCYNSEVQRELFFTPGKYDDNTFCYVGGLSVWQCFPETVGLYKQIEDRVPNAKLKIFTGDQDMAKSILKEKGVKNYELKYVKPDQLVNELASCKYGFIVRAESPVNYVATPTKLSNYMAAGLIPIVSNSVGFFEEILGKAENAVVLNGSDDLNKIINITERSISAEDIYEEFSTLFSQFYNTDSHIKQIAEKLQSINL